MSTLGAFDGATKAPIQGLIAINYSVLSSSFTAKKS